MTKHTTTRTRRTASLSREQIVDAAIDLLDAGGEAGLTFRALSQQLSTGPGALYGHIANKHDLIAAACEAVIARKVDVQMIDASPQDTVRGIALAMFDAMDAHPWVGPALTWSAGQMTMVGILERIGQQVMALRVPAASQWAVVSALVNYILGVGGQNANNARATQILGADRDDLLGSLEAAWLALDARTYPFVRSVAPQMRRHDDRADFLVGIDLILAGFAAVR